jgi:DNA ligase (NAD+)
MTQKTKPKNLRKKCNEFLKEKKPSKDLLKEVKTIIDYCSNIFYDEDKESPLTNEEFDRVYNRYVKFTGKDIPAVDSTSKKRNKNLVDTEHLFPELVGTLDKTNYVLNKDREFSGNLDTNTVEEWFNKLLKANLISPSKRYRFYISWKLDGNSITLAYNDKREVIMALTRGKDGLGSDKTKYFKNRRLPEWFPIEKGDIVGIKYEAITSFEDKERIELILHKNYASPCSLVSGLLSSDNPSSTALDNISLAPIRIQYKNKNINREEELELIAKLHEKTKSYPISINPYINIKDNTIQIKNGHLVFNTLMKMSKPSDIIKEIKAEYSRFTDIKPNLPYPVDGMVIELADSDIRESLGRKSDRNNFEFALKFPYDVKRTTVEDIEFYVSTNGTGRITPVVRFEPLKFDRAVCDHVSIANYKRFKELKLAIGDEVIIEYRNSVLSYLNIDEDMTHVAKPIKFITKCPMCGEPLRVNANKTFVHCVNKKCPSINIGKINNFLTKIGVNFVRENIINDLYNAKLVVDIPSLYSLEAKDIAKLNGYGKQSANNIIKSINSKKELFDYELVGSLGFKNIGRTTCKEIFKKYTIDDIIAIMDDELDDLNLKLVEINGIADITAKQFEKDFKKNLKLINKLRTILTVKEYKNTISSTSDPKIIVFTGFRDNSLQNKLEAAGHFVKSSVSKKTNILVTATKGSGSVKEVKAEELGIEIYSLNEFLNEKLDELIK